MELAFLVCFEFVWRVVFSLLYLMPLLCSHFLSWTISTPAAKEMFAAITESTFLMESLMMFLFEEAGAWPILPKSAMFLFIPTILKQLTLATQPLLFALSLLAITEQLPITFCWYFSTFLPEL